MKKFYVEESGYYKINTEVIALNEEDAISIVYKYIPQYINIEAEDRGITEVEE